MHKPDFYLFETLYGSSDTGLRFLDRHIARLEASAYALGFGFDLEKVSVEARRCEADLRQAAPQRVRICLERSGAVEVQSYPLQPLNSGSVGLLLGADWGFAPQRSSNPLLLHKTSLRDEYDRGWQFAESRGAFDLLFINERGEFTEGGRTNIFLQLASKWFTPPLASGILPGIMRGILLEDGQFAAKEKVLFVDDLLQADQILLCNSLRGAMSAKLASE
jgi:para-aminobenzoate synthetase/4-amino-4-deoxychorismate lyase